MICWSEHRANCRSARRGSFGGCYLSTSIAWLVSSRAPRWTAGPLLCWPLAAGQHRRRQPAAPPPPPPPRAPSIDISPLSQKQVKGQAPHRAALRPPRSRGLGPVDLVARRWQRRQRRSAGSVGSIGCVQQPASGRPSSTKEWAGGWADGRSHVQADAGSPLCPPRCPAAPTAAPQQTAVKREKVQHLVRRWAGGWAAGGRAGAHLHPECCQQQQRRVRSPQRRRGEAHAHHGECDRPPRQRR